MKECTSEKLLVYPYDISEDDISQIFYHLKDIWGIEQIRMESEVSFHLIMYIR